MSMDEEMRRLHEEAERARRALEPGEELRRHLADAATLREQLEPEIQHLLEREREIEDLRRQALQQLSPIDEAFGPDRLPVDPSRHLFDLQEANHELSTEALAFAKASYVKATESEQHLRRSAENSAEISRKSTVSNRIAAIALLVAVIALLVSVFW